MNIITTSPPEVKATFNSELIDISYQEEIVNGIWFDSIIFKQDGYPTFSLHLGNKEKEKLLRILQDFFIKRTNDKRTYFRC